MSKERTQRLSILPGRAVVDLELSDPELRTLAVIALHSDKDGWCWPSQSTIAELRGVARQTVNRHIRTLRERGYLNVAPRVREDGGQTSNMMQVRLDYPSDVTGGVIPESDRGCNTKEVTGGVIPESDTNKDPSKDTPKDKEISGKPEGTPSLCFECEKRPKMDSHPLCTYCLILDEYKSLFPNKTQHTRHHKGIERAVRARWKDPDFRAHWGEALQKASRSSFIRGWGGFNLLWFLDVTKSDPHWRRCYNGNYDDKGKGSTPRPDDDRDAFLDVGTDF